MNDPHHDATLLSLLEQAERARDAAEAALRREAATLRAAQAQHQQLVDYRGDYERRYAVQFADSGAGIDVLRCYQSFSQRLEQAIGQQARVVEHAERSLATAGAVLREKEVQLASVKKLLERRGLERQRVAVRREQHATDEAAARSASVRPALFGATGVGS